MRGLIQPLAVSDDPRRGRAVELRQPAVQVEVVGEEQLAEVGRLAPDHVVEEQVERRPQVGGERRVEAGESLRVLRQVRDVVDLEPREQELADLRLRPRVGEHPLGLLRDLRARGELAGRRGVEQCLVGRRIPEPEREPRGGREGSGQPAASG